MITLAFVVFGVALAAYGYWVILLARYPEPQMEDEVHIVTAPDLWKLRLYRRRPAGGDGEPVLLCHPATGNRFSLQFPVGASVTDALLAAGYDCWLLELRGSRSADAPFGRSRTDPGFDDYLLLDLPAIVDYIREHTGYEQLHWVGHSMGGMLYYAFEALYGREAIASAVTLAAPPGLKGVTLRNPRLLLAALRVSPTLVETVARACTPLLAWHPRLAFFPVNWYNMHPSMNTGAHFAMLEALPPRVARYMIECSTRQQWLIDGGAIDMFDAMRHLEAPLLAVFGSADPLVPLARAEVFFNGVPGPDKSMLTLGRRFGQATDYSHVDMAFARNGRTDLHPHLVAWLAAHPAGRAPAVPEAGGDAAPGSNGAAPRAAASGRPRPTGRRASRRSSDANPPAETPQETAPATGASGGADGDNP